MIKVISLLTILVLFTSCSEGAHQDNSRQDVEAQTADTQNAIELSENADTDTSTIDENLPQEPCDTDVYVYVADEPGELVTNIRNAPGGEVLMELRHDIEEAYYILDLDQYVDGWFRIKGKINGVVDHEIPAGEEGWIHYSVIAADTRNYGGQTINFYAEPDENSKINGSLNHESGGLRIIEACDEWVHCSYHNRNTGEKVEGWIKNEWLCGNPLTNCS